MKDFATVMNSSNAEYSAYNEEEPLRIHSESAGASLSMADAVDVPKSEQFQEASVCAALVSMTGLLALACFLTAAGVMFLEASIFIYICFSGPIILAPVIVHQRSKLERLPTLREVHNDLREEVNRFAEHNDALSAELNKLQRQKTRMKAIEERFQQICIREHKDAGTMVDLVKQNVSILKEIESLQAADELHALLGAMMKADKDGNALISENELDEVILRMKVFGGRKSCKFDESAIRAALKSAMTAQGASLHRVHSALQNHRKQVYEENEINGSIYNPIVVDVDEEVGIGQQAAIEDGK